MRFHIVTLGCPKNEVDSESIDVALTEAGHSPVPELSEADVVVVNTCAFIDAARAESVGVLREVSRGRRPGSLLIAAGCLAQREGESLAREVPGLGAVVGCRNLGEVVSLVGVSRSSSRTNGKIPSMHLDGALRFDYVNRKPAIGSAYLKISDGCDASCSFCAIPSIKGPYRSKPIEMILSEVRQLTQGGVREVVLVGQDTTAYGLDRGEREGLAGLLRRIAEDAPDLQWLRVLYLYPQRITTELLRTLAELPPLCRYVDIPLQHTHPSVLRRMKRPEGDVARLMATIRDAIPDVAIRTTFISGFPGETEEEHAHLVRSVRDICCDHVGVFAYSQQQGTEAARLPGQLRERVRERRRGEVMVAAQEASLAQNRRMVGRVLDVLVEGVEEGEPGKPTMTAGRSYRDAPEVDGLVLFSGYARVGEMAKVRITSALEYDLVGEAEGQDRGLRIES